MSAGSLFLSPIARASTRLRRPRASGSTRRSGRSSRTSSSSRSRAGRESARALAQRLAPGSSSPRRRTKSQIPANDEQRDHDRERAGRADREQPEVDVDAEQHGPDERHDAGVDARARGSACGAIVSSLKQDRRAEGAGPRRFAEPLAISFTTPSDFPILALADLLVRPCGAASTYSRCALGANGNLGGLQGTCKGVANGKIRTLRILNNQHFHSALCNLWITADSGAEHAAHERRERQPVRVAVHGAIGERPRRRRIRERERAVGGEGNGRQELLARLRSRARSRRCRRLRRP